MTPLSRLAGRPLIAAAIGVVAIGAWAAGDWYIATPPEALANAHYVGRQSCAQCHQAETASWTGSDHDRAMELATDETVLGDFNDTSFSRFEERTRFFRDGEKFMVNAEGPDGKYHDYEVKYTFGVRPLQQYMVEFPDGRVQVLRVSWDVKRKKWFYVAPADAEQDRIEAGDPLHWTGLAQNWNTMCAECHSTDYHKNFNLAKNEYHSEYFEIDVSCEACHGPGSLHVDLASSRSLFWDRNVHYGLTNTMKGRSNERQIETCTPCHSRRSIIHADYRPGDSYYDHFEPQLLAAGLYHADGQILDEVYEFASFTQSKMYHKEVRCSDCHNPHSLELRFEGNQLCAQCHQPGKYDSAGHNHHVSSAPGSPETQCVTCHMPESVYMGVDWRRDHSIRVPRPDLTVKLGTPNVCNRCHDKPQEGAQWAADAVVKWYGPKRPDDPHYAVAFEAARQGEPEGNHLIRELLNRKDVPDIVRATAVNLLQAYPSAETSGLCRDALDDPYPLVRSAAIRALPLESPEQLVHEVAPKLNDKVRTVRMAAAGRLVSDAVELAGTTYGQSLDRAIEEYREAQRAHLDRAQSNRNLANLASELGDPAAAVESFRTAIRLEPYLTGPRTELAQYLEKLKDDPARKLAFEKAGASVDEIRRLREEEVALLVRDAKLLPGDASPHYHRGRLLYLLAKPHEAREAFAEATRLDPEDYEYWMWLALIDERLEKWQDAVASLQQMARLRPGGGEWRGILQRIQQSLAAQGKRVLIQEGDKPPTDAVEPPVADKPPGSSEKPSEERGESIPPAEQSTDVPAPITPGQKHSPTIED